MNTRKVSLHLLLCTAAAGAQAGSGLVPPPAENVWPQWQARVALQATDTSPLSLSRQLAGGAMQSDVQREVQGGAILGDYYFARPSFGGFRASGGVMVGSLAGLPVGGAGDGSRLGMSFNSGLRVPAAPGAYNGNGNNETLPYLGLGFSSAPWRNGLAISADLGLVVDRGSALFGSQGFEGTVRELRLSPVLQLGVRYAF